jgi:hypothetical protein
MGDAEVREHLRRCGFRCGNVGPALRQSVGGDCSFATLACSGRSAAVAGGRETGAVSSVCERELIFRSFIVREKVTAYRQCWLIDM